MKNTCLQYNKNVNNDCNSSLDYASISIKKSIVDDLSCFNNFGSELLFLAATCITLTKYNNDNNICILTKIKNERPIPVILDDDNRKKSVADYILDIRQALNDLGDFDESLIQDGEKSHFNFIYFGVDGEDGNSTLRIDEKSQEYVLKFTYDVNKYTYSYIYSFLRSIKKTISQFVRFGISELKIMDIKLRDEEPAPKFKLKRNPLVNELLENQANKTPDKIALVTCGESYTFRQVNDEANRIANALINRGIKEGSSISFILPRNKTLITTLLGIIKAGCVAIPLDMNYPKDRIDYIMNNSDSKYIITDKAIEGSIKPRDLIDEGDSSFPIVSLNADDPIFILYTSGSTGTPKGVVSTHCGISNLISVHIKTNFKKLLSISSISFDISEEDILVALTNDMELIFANDDEIRDIVQLASLIEKAKPEFVNLTPSRLLSYLQVPEFTEAVKQFKGIGCGGEQFTKNVYESIKGYVDIEIYNGYGPLETSLTSNSKKIENPEMITNGKPLLNYITDVRDIDGKLLPYGVIGEVYIGGVGVSKGYYKLDERNREVFISINGIPYYKSGDYAVQLPSNEIIIKGRVDNQIKLRGQRVDPEEIEQVIFRYGDIANVVVVSHELNNEKHLCAYFTSNVKVDVDDLKNYLKNTLSPFMVPTFLIQLDKFPETPSGKVDRKLLPKPEIKTENESPANNFEEKLLDFCTNILNYSDFGVTDNLFNVGFTSLTLMKLNSDIYHEFDISLMHTDLMNNPTVRDISKLFENYEEIDEIEIIEASADNKYPMSSQQKRLYVIYRNNPDLINYNLPNVVKIKKDVDVERLEDAINKVIDLEEILRTSFHIENGEFIQKIHKSRPVKIDLIKLDDGDDINDTIFQNILPFNLEDDLLLRFKIIDSGEERYIFRDMHHIIGDQISNDLLYDKIKDAYYGNSLDSSDVQYKDYTLWVEKQQDLEKDYWMNKNISDVGTEIFTSFKRPLIQTFKGNKISQHLNTSILEKIAKENNTTIYKLLLSIFVVLMNKYSHEDNIQIGTVTSGRTHPSLEKTMGMFVNTLPFIQSINRDNTLKETIEQTEIEVSDLFANQNYSIEQIISDHNLSTNSAYNPLFNIVFIQNTAEKFNKDLFSEESKFDLSCTIKNSLSELFVEFEFNTDLYSLELIEELLENYVYLISNIQQNLDKKIKDIKLLSHSKEERIMHMAGSNRQIKNDSILNILKNQIDHNPDKIILADEDVLISYNDLDLKTNSFANYLKDKFNVKSQENIILIANRSIESVLAFYGILKLNAVYVPLNPLTPEDRVKYVIEKTNAKVVLTNISMELDDVNIVDLNQMEIFEYDVSPFTSDSQGNLCIIHTSGTTGMPKGVQITHENIKNFLFNAADKFNNQSRIFYHTTNIAFDTSLFEILFSILNGMQLYIIDENYNFNNVPDLVLNQKSIINTVPSKLKMFLILPNFEKVMENVDQLILAGEALNENLVDEIRSKYHPTIYNAYGPCEATIFATIKKITSSNRISIGKPNINTSIYILDDEKNLCPIGVPGELCIGGKQVSNGYVNDNVQTDKSFIGNPFGEGKIYCTGDLAYWDFDGDLYYLQRIDSQIKINGQRIEVDEVNNQIAKYEHITEVVTIPNEDKTQLYSYIVADSVINTDDLLNDLQRVLLPFMLPSLILQIDSIPLNNSGKIDIKSLPKVHDVQSKYLPPSNDVERLLIDIWEDILDVRPIGIMDNFYHLGGDSIKAIRVISLLQKNNFSCSARDIFTFKTPYLIAKNMGLINEISHDDVEGNVDLLPIQSYFFDEINRNDFTQEFILMSKKDLNLDILQKSLDELSNIHDMLRVVYKFEKNNVVQHIMPINTCVSHINEFYVESNLKEFIRQVIVDSKNSLDIENNLIDVSLIRYGNESYLVFVIHHLIVDGVSWSILIDDLTYIYNRLLSCDEIKLIKPYPYKYWVDDVKKLTQNIDETEKRHWIEINNLLDGLDLEGKSISYSFGIDISFDADNMLMLSEVEYLVLSIARAYKKTYGENIIFNYESHGRDESIANINNTFGWFTSQYPVLVDTSDEDDNIALIRDAYNVKNAFKNVNNLGLNYGSLIYNSNELQFRPCPVTFNFLSTEFEFKNEFFESVNGIFLKNASDDSNEISKGISINISVIDNLYVVNGEYPADTYLGENFDDFVENIESELEFISDFLFEGDIACALSESQLSIYLDELINDKGTTYSTNGLFDCGNDKSVEEITEMINLLIEKYPILKGRIVNDDGLVLLVCDSYPSLEVSGSSDYERMILPFDFNEYLARFYIIDTPDKKLVFYVVHHIISDASSINIISDEFNNILNNEFDDTIDLGFVYDSNDSFEAKFSPIYSEAHEFFRDNLSDIGDIPHLIQDYEENVCDIILPIRGIRSRVEEFCEKNSITVGSFLNAVFAKTYSRLTNSNRVLYYFVEHGRHNSYIQNSLGMYANTIPIVVDCKIKPMKKFLSNMSSLILNSIYYGSYPFRLLVNEFDLDIDVLFEYNYDLNDVSLSGEEVMSEVPLVNSYIGILFCVNDLDDGYVATVEHSNKYSNEMSVRFVKEFKEILIQTLNNE